jgi:branched-chain amino acid aminotransferase
MTTQVQDIQAFVSDAIENKPFGSVYADQMILAEYKDGAWSEAVIQPFGDFKLSPAAHVLHYGSECFEGMKAFRRLDGSVVLFRPDRNALRLQNSAEGLWLPNPGKERVHEMVRKIVSVSKDWVPESPGSLYIRPTLIGTLNSIGAAASPSTEALFYVILSPVGSYFKGGVKPLRILLDDQHMRTSPETGYIKTGGNYAAALGHIMKARQEFQADQVLFAPKNDIQETGAANFFLVNDKKIITRDLSNAFLPGITRDSILAVARKLGYEVEERRITVEETLEFIQSGEAFLSGTAAIIAGIGTVIYKGKEYPVGDGSFGSHSMKIRNFLQDVQFGKQADEWGWLEQVD